MLMLLKIPNKRRFNVTSADERNENMRFSVFVSIRRMNRLGQASEFEKPNEPSFNSLDHQLPTVYSEQHHPLITASVVYEYFHCV